MLTRRTRSQGRRLSRGPLAAIAVPVVTLVAVTALAANHSPDSARRGEPLVPIPVNRSVDPARVGLGEQLFQDVRLSHDRGRSCATCHPLERGGMDGRARAVTADGRPHARNTPTIFNVGSSAYFNWDGIADTLEAHAETVLESPSLMNIGWPELLARLGADDGYRSAFRAAYRNGLTRANVLDALAAFERSLDTPNSRFDRYLRGEPGALTDAERDGYELFKTYGCVTCHQGRNIGGNMFQRFGVFAAGDDQYPGADAGRYLVTRAARDRGVFRVPSLRNVAVTAPYFHDGRAATLPDAVDTMARVQLGRTLAAPEIERIVAFLHTLTGEYRGRSIRNGPPDERDARR